ncbi:hypothetical protein J4734_29315 [Klebsiella pneumoniae]|uniref:Integrase n=1 Tax=Klebsiella pneumoniae TaxID=573 RepID=A0A939NTU8_KLEPN|nr:hypothetical protein [Klebsiella pneumoniae]
MRFFDKQEKKNSKRQSASSQLRSVMNWCISRQLIPSCEVLKLSVKTIGKNLMGSRVLTYTELAKIWLALENNKIVTSNKVLHQLLLLWGASYQSCALATASEFNMDDLIWTTQQNIQRWVTLSDARCLTSETFAERPSMLEMMFCFPPNWTSL